MGALRSPRLVDRQRHSRGRPFAQNRGERDLSAHLSNDATADRQPEARPLADRLRGVERLEDPLHDLRPDASAVVDHLDDHVVA